MPGILLLSMFVRAIAESVFSELTITVLYI